MDYALVWVAVLLALAVGYILGNTWAHIKNKNRKSQESIQRKNRQKT